MRISEFISRYYMSRCPSGRAILIRGNVILSGTPRRILPEIIAARPFGVPQGDNKLAFYANVTASSPPCLLADPARRESSNPPARTCCLGLRERRPPNHHASNYRTQHTHHSAPS